MDRERALASFQQLIADAGMGPHSLAVAAAPAAGHSALLRQLIPEPFRRHSSKIG